MFALSNILSVVLQPFIFTEAPCTSSWRDAASLMMS